ncbi:MAG: phosphoribosylaminoimidazolesuccinocarboxamide synthase [Planctomycetota bacterium]|jgi:phosphoribosylaminoimidazole-succinocarboxamide synthase|nr:phosphoribosylaminoimidazolesuccinocarboxamide synthase [Planctomycetota bacterium]
MNSLATYLGGEGGPPGLTRIATGKVRDVYAIDEERLLFVTTDRISAFDVVMNEGIPGKGQVLTRIAAWWFEATSDLLPNHLLSTSIDDVPGLDATWRAALEGRIMIVRRARPTPVEWIVRGYLVGSGWKEYQAQGTVSNLPLPAGLRQASPLPEPLLTPSTKEETHDRPISPAEARELVGDRVFERAESAALALFRRGSERLCELGIILADTKFEFGLVGDELILIDEVLTPDSSRFWPTQAWALDTSPPSYDKQILRDYLETLDWNKSYPPPTLDPAVLERVASRYREVCELITGEPAVGAST